jgi:hypothetical protein
MEHSMSDYQHAQQFLDVLSGLDGDHPKLELLFPRWELLCRRQQDWLRRHLPLPDEEGDRMAVETITRAEDVEKQVYESRDALIRFLKDQGVEPKDFFHWLVKLVDDLHEIRAGLSCEYRSRSQLTEMQCLLATALITGRPALVLAHAQEHEDSPALPPFAPVKQLAERLHQPISVIRSCLTRYLKDHTDCREPVPRPRKGEPRFLYRTADVWPMLLERYGTPGLRDS